MMQPLSPNVRRAYLIISVVLFFAILPVVILYADGWRYQRGMGFVKTGGIFLSVPYADADIYMNGEYVGRSGFLDRSFYIDNLVPSAYVLRVLREGYRPWDRQLIVEQQLVTDARAVLVPDQISFARIATTTVENGVVVSQVEYAQMREIFATTTVASSTVPVDEFDGIGLFLDHGDVYARWLRTTGLPASVFCGRPSYCVSEIPVERGGSTVTYASFYNGGVVYRTEEGGIYFAEVDVRPNPTIALMYNSPGADARVIGDSLIIKDGNAMLEVAGL